nr:phosphodiester glycosidase family protein [Paraburkholderia phosphatilytica]
MGTTIPEAANVMQWLGATSATNLYGGGSSAMIVNGADVGHPSDSSPSNPTQRAVASSLVRRPATSLTVSQIPFVPSDFDSMGICRDWRQAPR